MNKYPDGSAIQTYTGAMFYPLDPRAEDVNISDIAHSLSLICRFAGHCCSFYSVGEHSLRVSIALEHYGPEIALWGLLHDASEAYLCDVPRPIKHDPRFAFYRAAEERVMRAICERFALPLDQPPEVDVIDKRLVVTEARDLLRGIDVADWARCFGEPIGMRITPMNSCDVEASFLDRFNSLMQLRKAA